MTKAMIDCSCQSIEWDMNREHWLADMLMDFGMADFLVGGRRENSQGKYCYLFIFLGTIFKTN